MSFVKLVFAIALALILAPVLGGLMCAGGCAGCLCASRVAQQQEGRRSP